MSKKFPHIVQIDADTHKILNLLSAGLDMTMGQIVKVMAIEYIAAELGKTTYCNQVKKLVITLHQKYYSLI